MIFLCHSSKDKPIVRKVARALKAADIAVWLDEEQINYGDNIVTRISEGLAASQFVLAFLSEHFLESEWVKHEWSNLFYEEVNRRVTKVIPVLIGDLPEELPPAVAVLRAKRYVDLRGSATDSSLTTFVDYLRERSSSTSENGATSSETEAQMDLQVRADTQADGSLSVRYATDGIEIATTAIASVDVNGTLSTVASQFPRVRYRFGEQSIAAIEDVAGAVSAFLIPSQVREKLRANSIRRLQVLLRDDDPQLPWELVHDGDGFVGLKIPIVNTPLCHADKKCSAFRPSRVVIVESIPDTFGIQLRPFLANYLTDIRLGDMSLTRVQARSLADLRKAMQRDCYDIIHYAGHTVTGPYVHFLLGDDGVAADEFCAALGEGGGNKLVILDSCESALCFPYREPSFQNNPAYLLARAGFHAVGSVGWLEMNTSNQFNLFFYEGLANCASIEHAMLSAKRRLFDEQKDWWGFSHFGIVVA